MKQSDSPDPPLDLDSLARDWITLWQSELAALAVDRETHETWQALLKLWFGAAAAMLHAAPRSARDGARRRAGRHGSGADEPPRPAPAAAAPDVHPAEVDRLRERLAALERRLAELERGQRAAGGGPRRVTRPRRSKPRGKP